MSKKEQASKFHSAFYAKPGHVVATNEFPKTTASSHDADKFKKPGEFFRSSQCSSQLKANRQAPVTRSSLGESGSLNKLYETVQSSQVIKPNKLAKPQQGLPRKTMNNFDVNIASTKAQQLQWERNKRLAKKAILEAQRPLARTSIDNKKNQTDSDPAKSANPVSKAILAMGSQNLVKNQQNDPWYLDNVWGDDLPVDEVEEALKTASSQEPRKESDSSLIDSLYCFTIDEWPGAGPPMNSPTPKTLTFTSPKKDPQEIVDMLNGSSFAAFLCTLESQETEPVGRNDVSCNNISYVNVSTSQGSFSQSASDFLNNGCNAPRPNIPVVDRPFPPRTFQTIKSFPPHHDVSQLNKTTCSNSLNSLTILPKDVQCPASNSRPSAVSGIDFNSQETLSQSQRLLHKRSHSTEWLRGQLEKVNTKYSDLKENVVEKEGENKLLREKLKSAEEEVKKYKSEKIKEIELVRHLYEKKLKERDKQLEAFQVQAMFKAKEVESSLEKYRELKKVSVRSPERPIVGSRFKSFQNSASRPGEASVLCEPSVSEDNEDLLCPTQMLCSPVEDTVAESPEKLENTEICGTVIVENKSHPRSDELLFGADFFVKNAQILKAAKQIIHGFQPKKELNHFLMPPIEYLSHKLRQTEFSEQVFENYHIRRPTLVQLWNTTYDAFGETLLSDYEKANVGDSILSDPALEILSKDRYFSTLKPIHNCILTLAKNTNWGSSERMMNKKLLETATLMARELYATLGDPRILQTTYTIHDRDPKIIQDLKSCPQHIDDFDPLSHEKWNEESNVELRRCLVFIGHLCSMHHMIARFIMNPKSLNSDRSDEFYAPYMDGSFSSAKKRDDKDFALRIILNESARDPCNTRLMQNHRDLYSKKLTIASELARAFDDNVTKLQLVESVTPSLPKVSTSISALSALTKEVLDKAIEGFENAVCRTTSIAEAPIDFQPAPSFEEFKESLQEVEVPLTMTDVSKFVNCIQNDLNPAEIVKIRRVADFPVNENLKSQLDRSAIHVAVPYNYENALAADILKIEQIDVETVLCAPIDRCISVLEREMLNLTLTNMKSLQARLMKSSESKTSNLDLTRYKTSTELDVSRKRKSSPDVVVVKKAKKYELEYDSPQFENELYSQIQMQGVDTEENVEPVAPVTCDAEDDQMTKFEKRQEIEELKKKMLAEKKEFEFKQLSAGKHNLAPFKIPGRKSPCSDPDSEILVIEQMFASQGNHEVLEASAWLTDHEDDLNVDLSSTTFAENDVEIEFIPDLVEKFYRKLENAALLELLSEIFKEGGVLRFTHRFNGLMLGTLYMLQNILVYQKREALPYCVKIATIVREILYTRPSPRILLEVNALLTEAVAIPGFVKLLCHNADTFVLCPNQVYFKRGACLLEVICILMKYSINEDSDLRMWAEMSHWIHCIICAQREHMALLYLQDSAQRRQCNCISAVTNTAVMIYHLSLLQYRELLGIRSSDISRQNVLKNIVIHGVQVLFLMHSYGSIEFLERIKSQYSKYRQLLTSLQEMHNDTLTYGSFKLPPADIISVSELLQNQYNPNPSILPEHRSVPDLTSAYPGTWTWPQNLVEPWTVSDFCGREEDD